MSAEVYDSFLTEAVIRGGTLKIHGPSDGAVGLIIEGDCIEGERAGKKIRAEFKLFKQKSPLKFFLIQAILDQQPRIGTEVIDSLEYAVLSGIFCRIRGGKLFDIGTV